MRRADLVTRRVNGEVVILDRLAGYVHQLNATASDIWFLCDGTRSPGAIAARLAERFDSVPETVAGDVRAALWEFERLGLLDTTRMGSVTMEGRNEHEQG